MPSKHRLHYEKLEGSPEENWLESGAKEPPNFLNIYPDVLTREQCREIIERFDSDSRVKPSWGKNTKNPVNRSGSMLSIGELEDWDDIVSLVNGEIEARIQHYARVFLSFQRVLMTDACVLTRPLLERIVPGQGFDWHSDSSQPGTEKRVLATILYLADINEGGETQFAYQMASVKPMAGGLVIFPPYWTHLHRGATPAEGQKYNLTNFVVLEP
jgi:hypothetical protein